MRTSYLAAVSVAVLTLALTAARADDWPEFRGKGRLGAWNETGILEKFPEGGLTLRWRTPINAGYSGPSVAGGRVFVTDSRKVQGNRMVERISAIDEASGKVLWAHEWDANYAGLESTFAIGPRATPTVDGDLVYALGAMGKLTALETATGRVAWEKDFVRDFNATIPTWGMVGAPIVDGDRLICLVGGEPDGKVIAFDKRTGKEIWRALSSDWEPGYNQPIIVQAAGVRQLIIWHPRAVSALDPATGKVYWEFPYEVDMGITVATPVHSGQYLLVSSLYNGARMLKLDDSKPGATLLWQGGNEAIHTLITTPVIDGDYLYGLSQGELHCWELKTGKDLWASRTLMRRRAAMGAAFFVKNGDRYFINNDLGELVIARLKPTGYEEISRTKLIDPTHPAVGQRIPVPGGGASSDSAAVNWSHPAYADKHIFVRNDKEIIKLSLAKE